MDWVFLISTYLSENGFIHLRFVKIIEKDGRQDGKRESLYFISHELDSLRQKATLDRNEYEELVKKYTLTALMMTKALLYLSRIGGLGAIFLPVLVFMPDVTMYYFGERFEELDKKRKRDEHLVGHALGDEFSKFERFRMRCTLAIITGIWILLPIVINERNLPFSSLYSNYFLILSSEKSILFSVLITGKVILGTPVSPLVPNLQRQLSYGTLGLLFIAVIALNTNMTILLGILIIAYSFSQAGILASLARDSVCVLAIIYSTFMNDFSFGLLDYLFVASLIFIHSVGKNKPGAVKLYSIFNFMYLQICLIASLSFMANLESLNFSETEVLWNDFPKMLRCLTLKVSMYMVIICLLLSGMQNVQLSFEGDKNLPDKFTAGYDAKVLINFFVDGSLI